MTVERVTGTDFERTQAAILGQISKGGREAMPRALKIIISKNRHFEPLFDAALNDLAERNIITLKTRADNSKQYILVEKETAVIPPTEGRER